MVRPPREGCFSDDLGGIGHGLRSGLIWSARLFGPQGARDSWGRWTSMMKRFPKEEKKAAEKKRERAEPTL